MPPPNLNQGHLISPAIRSALRDHLRPMVLGKDSERFDMGTEFQKDETRRFLCQILGIREL